MIVAIHQPEAFPWLGFFHKMHLADVFVILDTVQFEKNNVQNRNKILASGKPTWLTIPLLKHSSDARISDIRINWQSPIIKKHLTTLRQNYAKHPHAPKTLEFLENHYAKKHEKLADFNLDLILALKEKLGIKTEIKRASELSLSGKAKGGTDVTLEICKVCGADTYLSGSGAKAYLKTEEYDKAGIKVIFQKFTHPEYPQFKGKEFAAYLSILDLYLNHGPESLKHILKGNPDKLL